MLMNAAKFQGYSFNRFWVIKGKPTGGVKLPPPHIRVELIGYNLKNIFLEKLCTKCGGETSPRLFSK